MQKTRNSLPLRRASRRRNWASVARCIRVAPSEVWAGRVVVEIGGVGRETVVAEDAVGDVAVGEVDPLTDLLSRVHQPGGVLSPDTEVLATVPVSRCAV